MSNKSIPGIADDANELYGELTEDLNIDIDVPELDINHEFEIPEETGPIYDEIPRLTLAELTTEDLDGTGVFDVLMRGVDSHLDKQFKSNRLTGADYAKVYLGAVEAVTTQSIQFLLERDRAYWDAVNAQTTAQLSQIQKTRAIGEVELTRAQLQMAQYDAIRSKLAAYTSRNEYALSKMSLVSAYNAILASENQIKLTGEQYETQRAQTMDTRSDGTPFAGMLSVERELRESQMLTAQEELDTARAQTKETLQNGEPITGLVALQKQIAEAEMEFKQSQAKLMDEQYETARAQIRDDLSDGSPISGMMAVDKEIKLVNKKLVEEQVDAAMAQTKNTLTGGTPVAGVMAIDKLIKENQADLIAEQYEAQRAQTRKTLSTGEDIVGVLGAQTRLYEQQITSYKRDAESKFVKMLLDTWVARKTIDEGVPVPSALDGSPLNSAITDFRTKLDM